MLDRLDLYHPHVSNTDKKGNDSEQNLLDVAQWTRDNIHIQKIHCTLQKSYFMDENQ